MITTRMLALSLVATMGASLSPTLAVAAAAKKFGKQEAEVPGVAQTNLTKPAAPPKDQKTSGPVLTIDQFVEGRQDKIQELNDKQINQMQRLIRITGDEDPQKADFHFRLAELYAEKQRFFNFRARSLDQKIFDAAPGAKSGLQKQQKGFEDQQNQWLLKAVESYVAASRFKKYERMDEVLYKLAYMLDSVKKTDQAREFYHRLIKDYPNSKYVPYAYLSFAEFYFTKGEMDSALKFYERVEQFPKSDVYGYAVYKKGWCWINLGNFTKALEIFVSVVRISQEGKGGNKQQRMALEREAKKDIVKAYARVGNSDKAWEFFLRWGGDFAPKMMEALAELYWEQGMFADSTKVYRKLMALNETSPRICEWQNKVVRNTLSQGTKRDQVQQIQALGAAYEHVSKMQGVKKDVLEECRVSYRDTTKELAFIWHKEATKTKNPDTYQLVKFIYKEYLDHFSHDKEAYELAFYYAEVLFQTEAWKEAAEAYTRVVQMNPDPKAKWLKEAAYAAVISWKNALNLDDSGAGPDDKKRDEKDFKAQKIPEYQQKMIGAFDTYIKYVPNSPEMVTIKYRKARIYYDYNHFDEAIKLFQDVVDHHPDHELAVYSANLLLDSLNITHRSKEVVALADKFMKIPQLMKDPEFQKQMVTIKTDSYVIEAKRYESEKNFKECARSMEAAADSLPDDPRHAERLYDAGMCYQNARLIGQAIRVRESLIKAHPKDPLALKAQYKIASGYHQLASYTRAAEYYELFATKFPGEKDAETALGNATVFRIGLGDFDKAIEDMNAFIKFYGARKPRDAADVFFQMGDVYEKQNKNDELARHLNEYIKRWGTQGGIDKLILAHFKLGEMAWKKACPKDGVNGACIDVQRVTASGRQKVLYDINKKIKDRKKRIKEIRTQCGPPTRSKITIFERNKAGAKQAQDHFATVRKLWANGEGAKKVPGASPAEQQQRIALATYAAAGAVFYEGEAGYEEFLKVKFPEGLDFQKPTTYDSKAKAAAKKKKLEESTKKFKKYLDDKEKLAFKLAGPSADKKGVYDRVLEYKAAHWTIAASARIGEVYANFVDQLYTAEIPKDLKEQDEWGNRPREIFCDALVDKAEPIETKAVQGYELCLKAATEKSWFNEWSRMCEVELNQMQPSEYPLASEARPEAGYVSTLMTPAAVTVELPPAATITAAKQ